MHTISADTGANAYTAAVCQTPPLRAVLHCFVPSARANLGFAGAVIKYKVQPQRCSINMFHSCFDKLLGCVDFFSLQNSNCFLSKRNINPQFEEADNK